jgi:regulator of replication initiation timing
MNCNKTIARSDDYYLRCSEDCAGVFHLACVRVSKALFAVMKTEDKVRSWVWVGCSSDVTSPIPNIEQSVDNMFNLTSAVLSDTAGNTIKTDVLLPPFLPDSNTLNNVPDAFKNVFSEFSGTIYKYFEIFGASIRNHFNSLNGQLADLRKENSLLRTEIQKLTDKLSQKELLQNKSQDLPLSNVLSYADTIKRCASVVVMPKESSQAVSKTKSDIINKIDPSKSNVDISGVRSTKNGGLFLKCHFSNTNILYCFHGAFELTPYVSHKIRLSL